MNKISFTVAEETEKLLTGTSKLFGNPDVWDGFEWPHFTENGEEYDLNFVCQINCNEIAEYNKKGLLPKIGMLYFFYDMDMLPPESINAKASRVLYYDGDPASLHQMLRTDQHGNDLSLPEVKMQFGSDDQPHALLDAPPLDDWQPLLTIHAFETKRLSTIFSNKDALCFYDKEKNRINNDFSKVFVRLI